MANIIPTNLLSLSPSLSFSLSALELSRSELTARSCRSHLSKGELNIIRINTSSVHVRIPDSRMNGCAGSVVPEFRRGIWILPTPRIRRRV